MDMTWNHGYQTNERYASGFYRELLPSWLDFAAIVCGNRPPRSADGDPFRYLELGSGMGTHLCLMALTHPEGEFTGVDFHPDHVLHCQRLARRLDLKNIQFIEADFVDLVTEYEVLGDSYDYVVAHGIVSWVSSEVRESLISLASKMLCLGGLCYLSYNSLPGKLFLSPLQELSLVESRRNPVENGLADHPVLRAAKTLNQAQGTDGNPSLIAIALPQLRHYIQSEVGGYSSAYLSGEFLNEGWMPLYVNRVHRIATNNKLTYVGSATYPENFNNLLPNNIRSVIINEPNNMVRELIKDIAINQGFRRDIFSRGTAHLTHSDQYGLISDVMFCLQDNPLVDAYKFQTMFGEVTGDLSVYSAIEHSLEKEPMSFLQLQNKHERDYADLAQIMSFLCHSGRVGFYRKTSMSTSLQKFEQALDTLLDLQLDGYEYNMRPALYTGSAVPFSLSEAIIERCIQSGKKSNLMSFLATELEERGYSLVNVDSDVVEKYMLRRKSLLRQGVLFDSRTSRAS